MVGRVRRDLFSLDNMGCIDYSAHLQASKITGLCLQLAEPLLKLTHVNT